MPLDGRLQQLRVALRVLAAGPVRAQVGLVPDLVGRDRVARDQRVLGPEGAVRAVAARHGGAEDADVRVVARRVGAAGRGRGPERRRLEEDRQHADAVHGGGGHVAVVERPVVDARRGLDVLPVEGLANQADPDRGLLGEGGLTVRGVAREHVLAHDPEELLGHDGPGGHGADQPRAHAERDDEQAKAVQRWISEFGASRAWRVSATPQTSEARTRN